MKRFLMPLLFITIVLFLGVSIFSIGAIVKSLRAGFNSTNNNVVESILTQEISPELVKKQKVKSVSSISDTEIRVPYYWENGINPNEKDYLEGYVPSLSAFQTYLSKRQNMLFNRAGDKGAEDIAEVLAKSSEFRKVSSILYQGDLLNWNSNVCIKEGNNFVCPSWVSWSALSKKDKSYVLTECKVEGIRGFCVFEDYVVAYYNLRKSTEVRCYSGGSKFCNIEEYLKLREI